MKKIKRYLRKRQQIINAITDIKTDYETDECRHCVSPQFWEARDAAEIILSKMGLHKPRYVQDREGRGYAITHI